MITRYCIKSWLELRKEQFTMTESCIIWLDVQVSHRDAIMRYFSIKRKKKKVIEIVYQVKAFKPSIQNCKIWIKIMIWLGVVVNSLTTIFKFDSQLSKPLHGHKIYINFTNNSLKSYMVFPNFSYCSNIFIFLILVITFLYFCHCWLYF